MNKQIPDTLKLENGPLHLELAPHAGGSIAAFRFQRGEQLLDLMRPATQKALQNENTGAMSCFPLVPFSNRIENGRFEYAEKKVELRLNMAPYPHPLHGQGLQHPWQLIQHSQSSAAIVYEHSGEEDGWPWVYRAEQHFELTDQSLITSISLQNTGIETMPAGLGLHPFFPRTEGATLTTKLARVWQPDKNDLPESLMDIPDNWRFDSPRTLQGIVLDHCFTDWNGHARIDWPEYKLGLEITHRGLLKHLVIYAPEGEDYFCIEPVSHINNAINLAARGIENTGQFELAPDDIASAKVEFKVFQNQPD